MDYILYLIRSLYRKLFWILLFSVIIAALVFWKTRNIKGTFNVETTLYTGVISGYSLEDNNTGVNYALAQNAIDNLINIIQAESTLKRVSMNLLARVLVEGSPDKDQNGITAASYNYTYNHMKSSPTDGEKLISLIDKSSVKKTVENFTNFEKPDKNNYIYGLFYYQHPYYSLMALKTVRVSRLGNSDLLKVSYASTDPGIAYNTVNILMTEFVKEYRLLRYGETDSVIEFFKSQLDSIGEQLTKEEDDLTDYNVANRIINYYDETKEVAAINKEFELREQDIKFAYESSKAILKELERQMDSNTKQFLTNAELLSKLGQASELNGKISELETVSNDKAREKQLTDYQSRLKKTREELTDISTQYIGNKYSKNGLTKLSIVEQWLDQTLAFEKAQAELDIIRKSREKLNEKYETYAPVGTTIKRKERLISFSESGYLTTLRSYHDALMRKKNLEMTSASLKVLNPPAYPITMADVSRKKIVYMAFFATFLLLTAFFVIIELIDRTLRDSTRTRKLTNCQVIGAFPRKKWLAIYKRTYEERATQYLSNTVLRFFVHRRRNKPYILNLLSVDEGCGKTYVAEHLEEHWRKLGLKVRRLTENVDFNPASSNYVLANELSDLYTPADEDIVIVEHPEMHRINTPTPLLREANLNLMIVSALYGWKSTDKLLLEKLEAQIDDRPYLCLSNAQRYDIENYTGMLPPYTSFRKIGYRLSQLALTESLIQWASNWKKKRQGKTAVAQTEEDDDD